MVGTAITGWELNMKTAITVLFVIAMTVGTVQSLRHVYVKWVEPDTSVLDEFRDDVDAEIASARSLEDLVVLYREAREEAAAKAANEEATDDLGQDAQFRHMMREQGSEAERRIGREIQSREHDHQQLVKLRFYWSAGLIIFVLGALVFRRLNAWLGFSFIVIGFSEMLCWTSPLFHFSLMSRQFETLLNTKLTFSLITWILLIISWFLFDSGVIRRKE
jgi:hypothetical protein